MCQTTICTRNLFNVPFNAGLPGRAGHQRPEPHHWHDGGRGGNEGGGPGHSANIARHGGGPHWECFPTWHPHRFRKHITPAPFYPIPPAGCYGRLVRAFQKGQPQKQYFSARNNISTVTDTVILTHCGLSRRSGQSPTQLAIPPHPR